MFTCLLITSSSLSSMLRNTLIQYSTQQHSVQLEMKEQEQRGDEAEKTSFFVDKYLVSVGEKVVQSLSLLNRETMSQEQVKRQLSYLEVKRKREFTFNREEPTTTKVLISNYIVECNRICKLVVFLLCFVVLF